MDTSLFAWPNLFWCYFLLLPLKYLLPADMETSLAGKIKMRLLFFVVAVVVIVLVVTLFFITFSKK